MDRTAEADSPVPFQAMQTRRPTTRGLTFGAITTGLPLSNSTACNASEEETSSPESACGTTVRSESRAA